MPRNVNVVVTLREAKGDGIRLIKKFMKKVKKERIIEAYREKMFFEKPSSKRRRLKKIKKENARKAEKERNRRLNIK
jgi:ribosomal protein S21